MASMERGGARPARWLSVIAVALGALLLAAPAAAGENQDADISQSCNAGDRDSGGSSGRCSNQDRVVQQSAGGDTSRSITQRQSFGHDDRVRVRRDGDDRDDRDRDDTEFEATSESFVEEALECEDFSSQRDAQAALDEGDGDTAALDADGDGRACEEEFTQDVSGAPEGGVETGGGGTLARTEAATRGLGDLARVAGLLVALALVAAGLLGLRRGRSA